MEERERTEWLDQLARGAAAYEQRLAAVTPDQWELPSTCAGWTIKDLADHVMGGNRFAVALLHGATPADAFTSALADGFDGDPVEQFRESAAGQHDAFAEADAFERTVDHPEGVIPATTFFAFRLGDLVLHSWDLARSIGGDDSLDDELVPIIWETYKPLIDDTPDYRAFGVGPSGTVPDDAPLALRLLDLSGRRP
jgi:uncharacterized protein (TIGR03086 family)